MTTKEEIRTWLNEAMEKGCSHLLVVCDTFDWEDYPVMVYPKGKAPEHEYDDVHNAVKHYHGPNMQKVMEVYDLGKDIAPQLKMRFAGQEFFETEDALKKLVKEDLQCNDAVAESVTSKIRTEAAKYNISQSAAKAIVFRLLPLPKGCK